MGWYLIFVYLLTQVSVHSTPVMAINFHALFRFAQRHSWWTESLVRPQKHVKQWPVTTGNRFTYFGGPGKTRPRKPPLPCPIPDFLGPMLTTEKPRTETSHSTGLPPRRTDPWQASSIWCSHLHLRRRPHPGFSVGMWLVQKDASL